MKAGFTKHIALLIALLAAIPAVAQVMMPSAQSNRTEMLIGEQAEITLSLELTLQNDWPEITFPYQQDTLVENVEVVEVTPVDTVRPDESNQQLYKLSQRYTVTSFDSGLYRIKPFPIVVDDDTLLSNRLSLAVNTLQVDTTETSIFDIKDIYEVELTWQDYVALYWWIAAIVLGVGALAILGFYFWKQRQKRPATPIEKPKPKVPPHEIALAALRQLESEKAWEKNELKEYHTAVTDIIRDYIEARFMVPAHEQTSNEVLQNLRFVDMSQEATIRLRHVLKLADMVKFAKEKPSEYENQQALSYAKEFVEQTKLISEKNNPIDTLTTKEFEFDFVKQRVVWLSFFSLFLLFVILLIFTTAIFDDFVIVSVITSFAIPTIIFILLRKQMKGHGSVTMTSKAVEMNLDGVKKKFDFNEIVKYQIQYFNGVQLMVKLKSGKSINIGANDLFCNPELLENFTDSFEGRLNYLSNQSEEKPPVRKKPFYESKIGLVFLVIMSIGSIGVVAAAIWFDKDIPATIFTSLALIFAFWAAYRKSKSKKQKQD